MFEPSSLAKLLLTMDTLLDAFPSKTASAWQPNHGPTRSAHVIRFRISGSDATYASRGVATNSASGWIISWWVRTGQVI